ncbi:MAG: type II secretion system protein [Phycisphaerales bacterium]
MSRRAGFSLLDMLVTISVMAVLMSLLMPGLAGVREATRKVVCSSNVRQIGLATVLYADQNRGQIPPSVFRIAATQDETPRLQNMMTLRLGTRVGQWDGLGILYAKDYANTPGVYYCPSHTGAHPLARYTPIFAEPTGLIIGNYQYRGAADISPFLEDLDSSVAITVDGLWTLQDYNHKIGANVLTADMSVNWFRDDGQIAGLLAMDSRDTTAASRVLEAWRTLDRGGRRGGTPVAPGGPGGNAQ